MNQEYLRGFNGIFADDCIFTATPENIASFIRRYSENGPAIITTLDYQRFLTANLGQVDVCPDTKYLTEKLQPALARIKGRPAPEIILETVPQESVDKENCPIPDWNCLYWMGYSDQRFQQIKDKSCLLPFLNGYVVEVAVQTYRYSNKLAVSLIPWRGMTPDDEILLTVSTDGRRPPDHACLDIRFCTPEIVNWLATQNIAKPTGRCDINGPCINPEFAFNPERLRELDPEGYERHLQFKAEQTKKKERDTSR